MRRETAKQERNRPQRIEAAIGILCSGSRFWVQKRRNTGHLDGLWEFPGGKLHPGESPQQALLREVAEETGLLLHKMPHSPRLLLTSEFSYPERHLRIHFFLCPVIRRKSRIRGAAGRWIPYSVLKRSRMPQANRPVLQKLQK